MQGLNAGDRINRAFTELGYRNKIIWCKQTDMNTSSSCQELEKREFQKCSSINTNFCSGGIDFKNNWYLKF